MQKRNVVSLLEEKEESHACKAKLREECLFGSLADIRECLDYFKQKPCLNIIDKRLLLGVFQKEVEVKEDYTEQPEMTYESPKGVLSLQSLAQRHRSRHYALSPPAKGFSLQLLPTAT